MAVLQMDQNDLKMIAPHLMMFTLMRTDKFAYEDDPFVSQIFRGAQLLFLCQEEGNRERIQEVIDRFEAESDSVEHETMRTLMSFMVYVKLLLLTPKVGSQTRCIA